MFLLVENYQIDHFSRPFGEDWEFLKQYMP